VLQNPARPSGNFQLPYTTADMAERLAKKKAAKDRQDILDSLSGGLSYGQDGVDLGSVAKSVGGFLKTVYENMPESIDTPVSSYGTGKSLIVEPARLAVRRAVGDITAIPKVGEPSPSYTADRVREQGVALGVLGAAIDYSQFIPVVAKGAGVASDAINASRIARMNRSPFPTVKAPGAFIDVDALQGSRLPARIVDTPASPATRLAEAQATRALPPSLQRALPPASIPKPGMVIPDSLAGIRDLPTLPSQLNFADFQSMPEYQQYLQAGQRLPTAQELAEFGFDPERAYMVHSGPGDLVGGILDPNFTGARNMGTKSLNTAMREQLVTNYKQADSIVKSLSTGLADFEQTGIWNGPQILNNVTKLIDRDAARILPVNELGLNQIINVSDMPNKEFFVGKIRNMINSYQKTVTNFGPAAKLAEQGDYLSVFPASVGTYKGAVAPTNGATYLASSPAEQITNLMGFNSVAETGLPEYQMFGQQSPLASINYGNAGSSLNVEQLAAARAFFLRKVIEDRMARGLYEQPLAPTLPAPATRLAEAQTQRGLPPAQVAPTSNEIRNSIQQFIDSVDQKTGTITKQTSPTALLVPGNKFTIEPFVPTNQTTWEQGSRWTHYTTPEEAKSLLQNGILATSEKEGTNLGRVKGLPPGTFFAGQEGGPFMEYMATQYQEFVNPNNMTKVAVRIPQDAKILELTSERFAVEELREQNLSHSLITLWEQYLAKATAEHKFGDSFQVAATNFAKDLGFDAVRMDQQMAILPKQTTSSTPYITPTTPTTPTKRLAEAQTQRALPPAPTPEMTAQIQRQTARTELGLNIQDIDFPPKGNELTRPRMFDTSGYGVFPEDAWPELGLAQHKAGVNNTTMPEEMDALRTYFSNEYDIFQDLLRNPNRGQSPATKVFEKYIEKIDNIFKVTSPTTENFKVFRGVNADSPLADGEFVGAFYRSLKEGDYIVEPAYMSTSISKTVASEWANSHPDDYLLIIHAPKGSVAVHPIVSWEYGIDEIAQHMNAPGEQELLFNRGTVLKILSNDFGVIEAEMVPMYQQVDNPISTSGIKESLLKQYSYKDLAEMVAGEQSKADFYVEYFQTLPDLQEFLKLYKATNREYDLANTVVELNEEVYESINPHDYWKFRDIVDQIVDAKKLPLTTNNRYAVAKELLLLSDKHGLLYDGTTEFIRNNLDDIFQPPTYNPILDSPVTKLLANLKTVNKQVPVVLKNLEEHHLQELVEMIKTKPHIAAKMIWNQYLQHMKKLPNSNADFIKQVEALPKFFVDGNVISYQEAILLKKNIDANKPIG